MTTYENLSHDVQSAIIDGNADAWLTMSTDDAAIAFDIRDIGSFIKGVAVVSFASNRKIAKFKAGT